MTTSTPDASDEHAVIPVTRAIRSVEPSAIVGLKPALPVAGAALAVTAAITLGVGVARALARRQALPALLPTARAAARLIDTPEAPTEQPLLRRRIIIEYTAVRVRIEE